MLVERILVRPSHRNYKAIKRSCIQARVIYNSANYVMRQSFFEGSMQSARNVDKQMKRDGASCYRLLPSAAS